LQIVSEIKQKKPNYAFDNFFNILKYVYIFLIFFILKNKNSKKYETVPIKAELLCAQRTDMKNQKLIK